MQTVQAVIMGAVQGLTEFLPVSSSGHIVLASALYKLLTGANFSIVNGEEIFFDILIHLATLVAVIIYFFNDLKKIVCAFLNSLVKKEFDSEGFKFGLYIILATFITGVFGLLIKEFAHKLTESPSIVCLLLMVTGLILFFSEKFASKERKINFKVTSIIGFFQGFSVFPGLSRSGLTISSAVFMGIKRTEAAKFSFILSIPIIFLASLVYPMTKLNLAEISSFNIKAMILGVLSSFIVGYFCIKYFMKFLKKCTLKGFAYYCFIVGIIFLIIFSVK